VLYSASTVCAEHAQAVGIVHDQPCVMGPTRTSEKIKRPNIAIHAKHAIRSNDSSGICVRSQRGFRGGCIRMRVSLEMRTGQQSTVYQRRMAQPIQQHRFAPPSQRGDHRKICHVASGKQQRSLASRERRKLLLEATVFGAMSRNQMRSGATGTAASGALRHRGG
jgi:hypothetical protein